MTATRSRPVAWQSPPGALLFAALVLLSGLWPFAPRAADTPVTAVINADHLPEAREIDAALRVFPDPAQSLTAEALLSGRALPPPLTIRQAPANLGYPRHRYWLLLDVRNDEANALERLLVWWRGSAHTLAAYWQQVDSAGRVTGPIQQSRANDLHSRHAVLRLALQGQEHRRIAIRIDTWTALTLDFRVMSAAELAERDRYDFGWAGLFTGAKLAIGLYAFALYFATRDRLYLLFAGYAAINIAYTLHTEVFAYLLWPVQARYWGNLVNSYTGALFSLFVAQFVRVYLNLPRTQPRMDRWVLLPAMAVFISSLAIFPMAPWLANSVAAFSAVISIFLLAGMVVRSVWIARPPGSFLIGMLFSFAAGITHLCRRLGLLPDVEWIALLPQLGGVATLIAFAVALMERVRRMVDEARRNQERYAERLSEEVTERTEQLSAEKQRAEDALSELKGAQSQLVASEKMASLGQLVAGVAHEINTPIGIAVTATSHMQQVHGEFSRKADAGSLSRSDLGRWRATVDEAGRLIMTSLERAHTLIGSFKQVAVDQSSERRRRFELASFLEEVQFALQPSYKRTGHILEIDCPPGIELDTYPGALFQVLTNLVNNSVLHGFLPESRGCMRVVARADAQQVFLLYSDDGVGMPPAVAARAFDPFFTTRRGTGGSGLGLHLVYNLISQLLAGHVEMHSTPGQGTEFEIRFPRVAPTQVPAPGEVAHGS